MKTTWGVEEIVVEYPYIRAHDQGLNVLRFCETAVRLGKPKKNRLVTRFDNDLEKEEAIAKLRNIGESLKPHEVELEIHVSSTVHDRETRFRNGWTVKNGRGLEIYQKPDDWLSIGASDLDLSPSLETTVDIYRT